MRDGTIKLIYKLKQNIYEDPVKIVKEHICAFAGILPEHIGNQDVYTFVQDAFFDFFNTADDKALQFQSYFYAKSQSGVDDVHAMLIVLRVSQVRNENMEFINGFREIEGVDWPSNNQ